MKRPSVVTTFNYIKAVWSNGPGVVSVAPESVVTSIERALSAPIRGEEGKLVRVHSDVEGGLTLAILRSPKASGSEPASRDARRGSFCHVIASDHPAARSLTAEAATRLYEFLYGIPLFDAVSEQEQAFMVLEFPSDREAVTSFSAGQDLIEGTLGLGASGSPDPRGVSSEVRRRVEVGANRSMSHALGPDLPPLSSLLRDQTPAARSPAPATLSSGASGSSALLEGEAVAAQTQSDLGKDATGTKRETQEPDLLPLSSLLSYRSSVPLPQPTAMPSSGAARSRAEFEDEVSPESEDAPKAEPEIDSGEPVAAHIHGEMGDGEPAVELPARRSRFLAFRVAASVVAFVAVSLGVGVIVRPILFGNSSIGPTEGRLGTVSDEKDPYAEMKGLYGWQPSELETALDPRPLDTELSAEVAPEDTVAVQAGVSPGDAAEQPETQEAMPTAESDVAASSQPRPLSAAVDPSALEVLGSPESQSVPAGDEVASMASVYAPPDLEAAEEHPAVALNVTSAAEGEGGRRTGAAADAPVSAVSSAPDPELEAADREERHLETAMAQPALAGFGSGVPQTLSPGTQAGGSSGSSLELAQQRPVEAGFESDGVRGTIPEPEIPARVEPVAEDPVATPVVSVEAGDEIVTHAETEALPPVSSRAEAEQATAGESAEPRGEALRRKRKRNELMGRMQRYR